MFENVVYMCKLGLNRNRLVHPNVKNDLHINPVLLFFYSVDYLYHGHITACVMGFCDVWLVYKSTLKFRHTPECCPAKH